MAQFEIKAFTIRANGILPEIVSDIGVSVPFVEATVKSTDTRINKIKALWDTGATGCSITKEVAERLNLKPVSRAQVHHADGMTEVDVYLVNIFLPNNIIIPGIHAFECKSTAGKFDMIIGMNIITLGDFSITNFNRQTVVSFRVPSLQEVDYVKEINSQLQRGALTTTTSIPATSNKVQRNDPCPCNSGKKFKDCHGKVS